MSATLTTRRRLVNGPPGPACHQIVEDSFPACRQARPPRSRRGDTAIPPPCMAPLLYARPSPNHRGGPPMRILITCIAVVTLVTGCATTTAPTTNQVAGNVYSGEVWTWDERENIVTLRQGTQK